MQSTRYDKVLHLAFSRRRGVTLIELLVTIIVLSIVLAITTLSLAGEKRASVAIESVSVKVRALRSGAIASGVPRTATLTDSAGTRLVTALPDGRVISDMPGLDRMAGAVTTANAR